MLCDSRVEIVITAICHAYHSDQGLTIKGTFWTLPSVILVNFRRVYAEPFCFPIC